MTAAQPTPAEPLSYSAGGLLLDRLARRVTFNGQLRHLPPAQFNLLALLMSRPGHAFTVFEIIDLLWPENPVSGNNVTMLISYLRKSLGPAGALIKTVRGAGYTFTSEPEKEKTL